MKSTTHNHPLVATCHGMKWLRDYMYQFTLRVYKPAYGDFEVLVNSGNTDGWNKVVQLLWWVRFLPDVTSSL